MTTREKVGLALGIPSWIPIPYKGVPLLGAAAGLVGMLISYTLLPKAGIVGEAAGLVAGYYLTLAIVLPVGVRSSWIARALSTSGRLGVWANLIVGSLALAFGVVGGIAAYFKTYDPLTIVAGSFGAVCGIILLRRAQKDSARAQR